MNLAIIISCAPSESLGSNVNELNMPVSKVVIYKIHTKNVHIFEVKTILRVNFSSTYKQDIEQLRSVLKEITLIRL